MTAAADLSAELVRQHERIAVLEAKLRVANMHADAAQDVADSLAENLSSLLSTLTDAGVLVQGGQVGPFDDGEPEFYWWATVEAPETEREALADAIRSARQALADYEDHDPPMCPCGEPATVELLGDSGWLCGGCAA